VALVVERPPATGWTPRFAIVLEFLGLVTTAATKLARLVEPLRAWRASLTVRRFQSPAFGPLIGIVVLGERPTAWMAVGISVVPVGMWLALTKQPVRGSGPPGATCSRGVNPTPTRRLTTTRQRDRDAR